MTTEEKNDKLTRAEYYRGMSDAYILASRECNTLEDRKYFLSLAIKSMQSIKDTLYNLEDED